MTHYDTLELSRPARTQRTNRLRRVRTIDNDGWLMQWHFSRRESDRFGPHVRLSFVSLVTRPGMPGIWIDAPYHCYAGTHRYRRLSAGLATRVRICLIRGAIHEMRVMVQRRFSKALQQIKMKCRYYSPAAIRQRHRLQREWNADPLRRLFEELRGRDD